MSSRIGSLRTALGVALALAACERADPVARHVEALESESGIERATAANELASTRDERAVEALFERLLVEGDDAVDAEIRAAVVSIGAPAVEPLLARLASEEWTARRAAVELLGRLEDGRAVEPLLARLDDADSDVRRAAVAALGSIGDARAVEPLLARFDEFGSTFDRCGIATALGDLGDARAVEPLTAALAGEHSDLHLAAVLALEKLGKAPQQGQARVTYLVARRDWDGLVALGAAALDPLAACLDDYVPEVQIGAALALGRLGDERATRPLADHLDDQLSSVRRACAESLAKLGYAPRLLRARIAFAIARQDWDEVAAFGEPAVEPLIELVAREVGVIGAESTMPEPVSDALVRIGAPSVEPLIALLKDEDWELRPFAVSALGRIGDERAIEPLMELLAEEQFVPADDVIAALAGFGTRAIEPLARSLQHRDPDVRRAAADALQRLGYAPEDPGARAVLLVARQDWPALTEVGAAAVDPLLLCLEDEETHIRGSAIETLASIGDRRALAPLREALPDWFVNAQLVAALEVLGWTPSSPAETVYAAIGHADGEVLRKRWSETHDVLIADVRSKQRRKIENAVYAFVSLGDAAVLPELVRILDEEGNVPMAETYLNCGHADLDRAAREWADARGYLIMIGVGACNATWGGW